MKIIGRNFGFSFFIIAFTEKIMERTDDNAGTPNSVMLDIALRPQGVRPPERVGKEIIIQKNSNVKDMIANIKESFGLVFFVLF